MNKKAVLLLLIFLIAINTVPFAAAETLKDKLVSVFSFEWASDSEKAAEALMKGLLWFVVFIVVQTGAKGVTRGTGGTSSNLFTSGSSMAIAIAAATGAVAFLPTELVFTWFAGFGSVFYAILLMTLPLMGYFFGWKVLPGMGLHGRMLGLFQLILIAAVLAAYQNFSEVIIGNTSPFKFWGGN